MINEALELAKDSMEKAYDRAVRELGRIRAGRANPAILDDVRVDSYGSMVPLNQVSTVSVGDARLLVVKPWDRNLVQTIERAINNAGLGLNASNDGVVVRVPIPPLTEERRKGLVKQAKEAVEEGRIAVRQGRRDANDFIKEADGVSEDDQKKAQEKIQKLTDDYVKKLDDLLAKKEAEIMEG